MTTNRKAQSMNGNFKGSSTEHHTKPGVATGGNKRQRQKETDWTLVLTDLNSVSIELFGPIENILEPIPQDFSTVTLLLPSQTKMPGSFRTFLSSPGSCVNGLPAIMRRNQILLDY